MNTMRLKPILLAFLCTFIVISCAGFAYDYIAKDKPFADAMNQLQGSEVELVKIDNNEKMIVSVNKDTNLKSAIEEVNSLLLAHNKSGTSIEVSKSEDELLNKIWEQYLFEVADIMANKNFADFPRLMQQMEEGHNISAEYTMDEQYIYVTMTSGDNRLDHILPIHATMMGVWSNETELE